VAVRQQKRVEEVGADAVEIVCSRLIEEVGIRNQTTWTKADILGWQEAADIDVVAFAHNNQ
jgi:hypothetical protein